MCTQVGSLLRLWCGTCEKSVNIYQICMVLLLRRLISTGKSVRTYDVVWLRVLSSGGPQYCPVADRGITAAKRDSTLPQNSSSAWSAFRLRRSQNSFVIWYSIIVVTAWSCSWHSYLPPKKKLKICYAVLWLGCTVVTWSGNLNFRGNFWATPGL